MCSCSKESTCFFSRASIFFPCWWWSSYIFTIPSNKFDQWPVYKRIGTCYLWVNSIHDIGFLVTMGTFVKTLKKPCLNIVDISLRNWPIHLVKNWLMLLEAPTQATFISSLLENRRVWRCFPFPIGCICKSITELELDNVSKLEGRTKILCGEA